MKTKKLTFSAMLIAIGVVGSSAIYIPIGVSKCAPLQHTINVLAAVTLGPYLGVLVAFLISLIRNMLGTGSLLAFPGSIIGVFLAGILYKKFNKTWAAVAGEIFGTGILGGLLAFPIAKFVLGKNVAAFFFIPPFMINTIGGSILGFLLIFIFKRVPELKSIFKN